MSEVVSMSSGPQGTATNSEAFAPESSSSEFGQETPYEVSLDAADSGEHGENVPGGTNGEGGNGDGRPKSAAQRKQLSKYERTKKQRAEFNRRQEALTQREQQLALQQAQFEESKKPKRDYSLGDLKKYRAEWAREAEEGVIPGRAELVSRADAEIAAMEAEEKASKQVVELPKLGTPEHRKQWNAAEAEIRASDPDFMQSGTRLDTKLREIFAGPNSDAYRSHPQGIYAAYDRAKRELLEEDVKGLRTENSSLKKELQRYGGLTSIGGGVPGRVGDGGINSTADFARLSTKDMRAHLAKEAKRTGDKSGWL
jgi:hypothetical protein